MPELNIRPWLSIWIRPRATIRSLVNYNVKYRFFALSFIYGLPILFQLAQDFRLGSVMPLTSILVPCIVLAPVAGYIGLMISAVLLTWIGKWLGGFGSFLQIRCAVSWSSVPNIVSILVWASLIVQLKAGTFVMEFAKAPMSVSEIVYLMVIFLIQIIASVWSLVLLLQTIREVHGFSIWKSLLSVVMSIVITMGISWMLFFMLERISDVRV